MTVILVMERMISQKQKMQKSSFAQVRQCFQVQIRRIPRFVFVVVFNRLFFNSEFNVTSHARHFQKRSSSSFSHYVTKSKLKRLSVSKFIVVSIARFVFVVVVDIVVVVVVSVSEELQCVTCETKISQTG